MGKIFVTGATGTNGKALVEALLKKNADFVVGSRNVAEAQRILDQAVDIRRFDFSDATTYTEIGKEIDKVFLLGPPLTLKVDELINPFLDFLKSKKITRVVYFSAMAADKMGTKLDFHTKIEQKLKDDNFDYTILKPSFFAQNFKNYESENILERNIVFMPAGNGKAGFVDVKDIAAVAAVTLTTEGHTKKTYELTGPELLSYKEVASLLSEVLHKEIIYPNPSVDQFKEVLQNAGAPAFIGEYLSNVYQVIANNEVNYVTNDVESITGKKPTALKEVITRDFLS
ncbi:SDR family oxidoreductase [Flavobacterium sedimenticola]|uniref:SDR family oxidoreductase n=1 Tax=Flavobacterium sedimenticola TaxID=3043286 RepID=A0ABT6XSL2_9FLAO|nr:SDR family oxidoreductase [Flavobacterium sedimenticola]MDI9257962.1 SDR family oxidoreductase [Flavobacterium sedimenticola]